MLAQRTRRRAKCCEFLAEHADQPADARAEPAPARCGRDAAMRPCSRRSPTSTGSTAIADDEGLDPPPPREDRRALRGSERPARGPGRHRAPEPASANCRWNTRGSSRSRSASASFARLEDERSAAQEMADGARSPRCASWPRTRSRDLDARIEVEDDELTQAAGPEGSARRRATSFSRSAPAPAATRPRSSPATCSACTRATPSARAGSVEVLQREPRRARRLQGNHQPRRRRAARIRSSSSSRARIACSACRPPKRRDASTPRPAPSRSCRSSRRSTRSSSIRRSCASTPFARRAPADSTSTRPTRRSASRTCRPASSSNARTSARSTRTARARCRCCARGCSRREQQKQTAQQAQERKLQVGTGDRSERIRTYNYPQGRVTDHRINLTLYQLPTIMDGALDDVIGPLQQEWQAEQLASLE